jgi:uncharacterized protein (TIGR02001 family)
MKKLLVTAALFAGLAAASASAADLKMITKAPPPAPAPAWDIAFGGSVSSDYNFRGVSQSNRGPSGGAYFEPQLTVPFGQLYVGLAGWAIDWPFNYGFTDPSAEIDFYGGWRGTFGKFSLDLGAIYYYYPREQFTGLTAQSDFWEFYAKGGYAITDSLSVGANVFYTPDLLHYSTTFTALGVPNTPDAVYGSVTGKWVLPWKAGDLGAFVSGELGHWWINNNGFIAAGLVDPSYTYWNAGLAFTYKAITVDLRYHGNDMSVAQCGSFLLTGVPNPANSWCDDRFVASLKFDTSLNALK